MAAGIQHALDRGSTWWSHTSGVPATQSLKRVWIARVTDLTPGVADIEAARFSEQRRGIGI